ncbi:putative Uncharacterized membrane protein YngC [Candidatus Hydrogenisulfobacillus filiaventi]|uniref:Putative Uncharacterized membrane protein YngC n=1 Tax=Candidatus Hydrogenisulfobacillus filiaventi TaxID=2707344 RepID=A0A6F8ZHD5_9FIRM|nr:DedA family protein [Bacillota bacterium]CAB1128865.1 putative Uncharacterized membrane protein YngC [Candidatus Hydrogenisulfobacillus filiaventi]
MHTLSALTTAILGLGLWGVFWGMFLESAYIPLPSEIILPYAGYLVSSGRAGFWTATLAALAGGMLGATAAYLVARAGGKPLLERYGRYLHLSAREVARAEAWFRRYGDGAVFFGRLLPAVRTYISLPAGLAAMPLGRFLLFSLAGALPWTLLFVWLGRQLGQHWQAVGGAGRTFALMGLAAAGLWALWSWWRERRPAASPRR